MRPAWAQPTTSGLPATPADLAALFKRLNRDAPPPVAEVRLHPFDYLRMPKPAATAPSISPLAGPVLWELRVVADRTVPIGTCREYDGRGNLLGELRIGATEAEIEAWAAHHAAVDP